MLMTIDLCSEKLFIFCGKCSEICKSTEELAVVYREVYIHGQKVVILGDSRICTCLLHRSRNKTNSRKLTQKCHNFDNVDVVRSL